eukprot:scaffold5.g999.t1
MILSGQSCGCSPPGGTPVQGTLSAALLALQPKPTVIQICDEPVEWGAVANAELSRWLGLTSKMSKMSLCHADKFTLDDNTTVPSTAAGRMIMEARPGALMTVKAHNLPCRMQGMLGCCDRVLSFRTNTTDFRVFEQASGMAGVFLWKWMSYLYTIYSKTQPQYILDAGANVGFSTVLYKMIWPDATIVAVEPNATNFKVLQKNTEGLKGVHLLQAGLWGRKAKIGLAGFEGEWGNVFKEVGRREGGLQAYSVRDIAKMFDIPSFDMVKIDIEGAEGMVFAPGADMSWVDDVKVGVMEVHDRFAGYFGLRAVGSRVKKAFDQRFDIAWDNEHVVFINKTFLQALKSQG